MELVSVATRLEADGDYLAAEEVYGRILSTGFQVEATYVSRGNLRVLMQRYPEALEDFDEAHRLNPQLPYVLEGRSRVKRALGDVEGALKDAQYRLNAVKKEDPDYTMAYYERGLARRSAGHYTDAIGDFSYCIDHDPAWEYPVIADRGLTFALEGDRESALRDLERAAALEPAFGYWQLWVAGIGGSMNLHTVGAQTGLSRDLETVAKRTDWPGNLARFYMGQTTEEELLKEADNTLFFQERLGRRCEAHTYIGLRDEARGFNTQAIVHYEKAVATRLYNFYEHLWSSRRLAVLQDPSQLAGTQTNIKEHAEAVLSTIDSGIVATSSEVTSLNAEQMEQAVEVLRDVTQSLKAEVAQYNVTIGGSVTAKCVRKEHAYDAYAPHDDEVIDFVIRTGNNAGMDLTWWSNQITIRTKGEQFNARLHGATALCNVTEYEMSPLLGRMHIVMTYSATSVYNSQFTGNTYNYPIRGELHLLASRESDRRWKVSVDDGRSMEDSFGNGSWYVHRQGESFVESK